MNLYWLGETAFKIETKSTQHDEVTILCDPYLSKTNALPRNLKSDIVLGSRGSKDMITLSGEPFTITTPGEYEVKDVMVYAHLLNHAEQEKSSLIFQIETEHLSIVHLGACAHSSLPEELESRLGAIDILIVPVGGGGTLTADQASKLINDLEPRLVIPTNFNPPNEKQPLESVDKFLKLLGQKEKEWLPKLKIAKRELPNEETRVVLLSKN
ncbi:MAG: MBL fold metallo-hydrolase [Candidatus Magasanikbacteria bacterium]|nr:MBL fold metallo-hydrolase [Candidatus Magasanikbacteria bacterium]